MKKYFRVEINVTSTAWETCDCVIEAESAQHARKLFDANPDEYEWDNWEHSDSEVRNWDVEHVEYDEGYTKYIAERDTKDEKV